MDTIEDLEVIPLVDLHAQHREVADEVKAGIDAVLEAGAFIGGAEVVQFEKAFASFTGADHCIGVANGTDAIELALRAAQLPVGSTVVLPANTFIATAEAAVRAGLQVRLVDCEPVHALIDVEAAKRAIDAEVSAVIAVDLYGQVAPFERLSGLGVAVVEDAAQSQGATRFGRGAGTFGIAAGTSFYPGKNLGAYGDAGAVLTGDAGLAERVRALRNHGGVRKYEHDMIGVNSRLDTIQAVVLNAKLARLAGWNAARRAAAARYAELLVDVEGVRPPGVLEGNEHVWHLYVIELSASERRDDVVAALNASGVGAGIHYPTPLHLTRAFGHLGHHVGDFPVAEGLAGRILSLPLFPGITERQQVRVVEVLRAALGR